MRDLSHHEKHVWEILKALLKADLYAKLSKCLFSVSRILFLGFILTNKDVEIEKNRILTILNWLEPEFFCNIQSFLRFANYYGRFVKEFLKIAHTLTNITKKATVPTKKDLALQKTDFLTTKIRKSFSWVGWNFYQLTVFCLLWCKATNKARDWRFKLFDFWNLIVKIRFRIESGGPLLIKNNSHWEEWEDLWY